MAAGNRPAAIDLFLEGWTRVQRSPAGVGAVAAATRTAAGSAQRPESDAGAFHPGATNPGRAYAARLFGGPRSDADALCAGAGDAGRPDGICSSRGTTGGCNGHRRCGVADGLHALARADRVSRHLAPG